MSIEGGGSTEAEDEPNGAGSDAACVICMDRPKAATLVHGGTGHMCACLPCARTLHRMGQPCPICRKSIDAVIKQFL